MLFVPLAVRQIGPTSARHYICTYQNRQCEPRGLTANASVRVNLSWIQTMEVKVATLKPTIVAVFDDRTEAERAVSDLEAFGFDDRQIGYAIRGTDVASGGMITDTVGAKDARGAIAGATTGAMVGGVLAAAASMLLPGVGPVIAGGVLASFFGGAVAGTCSRRNPGAALTGLGISEDEARYYEQAFHSGKANRRCQHRAITAATRR